MVWCCVKWGWEYAFSHCHKKWSESKQFLNPSLTHQPINTVQVSPVVRPQRHTLLCAIYTFSSRTVGTVTTLKFFGINQFTLHFPNLQVRLMVEKLSHQKRGCQAKKQL